MENPGPTPNRPSVSFSVLLVALSSYILFVPFVGSFGAKLGFIAVLVVGLVVARETAVVFRLALTIVGLILVSKLIDLVLTGSYSESNRIVDSILATGYLFFLVIMLLRSVARSHGSSLNTVLGGINVYLLMAIAFMTLHSLVEKIDPGSYMTQGVPISEYVAAEVPDLMEEAHRARVVFLYFSFTTLTTLGYGDIVPAQPVSQILCGVEAVIGQLYVAIFIGGLVALHVSTVQERIRARG